MITKIRLLSVVLIFVSFQFQSVWAAPLRVAVIGGGLAGTTFAYRVQRAGVEVDVFEARKRVGGRVFTVKVNQSLEELGGKDLSDGGGAKNIIQLANELGLSIDSYELPLGVHYVAKSGQAFHIYKDLMASFPPTSEQLLEKLKQLEASSKNLGEVLDKFFEGNSILRAIFEAKMRSYEGAETTKLSPAYAHGSFYWMLKSAEKNWSLYKKGEPMKYEMKSIRGGNAQLPLTLAKKLGEHIHTEMVLTEVRKNSGQGLELVFNNQTKVRADILVLTIPCSVFGKIRFKDNVIPAEQLQQISRLSYGNIAKILVPTPSPDLQFPSVLSDQFLTWMNSDHRILTLYYAGKSAVIRDSNQFEQTLKRDVKSLQTVFSSFSVPSNQVHRPKDEQLSSYTGPVGLSWALEPYTQGGYSNFSPAQYALLKNIITIQDEPVIELFKPVGNTVYFAGEHTAINNPATMEGAVESGERIARIFLKSLKNR